jgi:hypothetical protein
MYRALTPPPRYSRASTPRKPHLVIGRYREREVWGDLGRSREIWGDLGRSREI